MERIIMMWKFITILRSVRYAVKHSWHRYVKIKDPSIYGHIGFNAQMHPPMTINNPKNCFFAEHSKIREGLFVINTSGKFIVKKYTTISINCLVVTGNHRPTVGIPEVLLDESHINDVETDIIVEEGVWIGANCTLIAKSHIGRGAVIGANSLINKPIPPYAVAVGSPAKIIASVFTLEQIIEHEKFLYPENERFTKNYLEELFTTYFSGMKSIGLETMNRQDMEILEKLKSKRGIKFQ